MCCLFKQLDLTNTRFNSTLLTNNHAKSLFACLILLNLDVYQVCCVLQTLTDDTAWCWEGCKATVDVIENCVIEHLPSFAWCYLVEYGQCISVDVGQFDES